MRACTFEVMVCPTPARKHRDREHWRTTCDRVAMELGLGMLAGCPGGDSAGGGNVIDAGADASDDAAASGKGGAPAKPTKPAQGGAGGSKPDEPAEPDDDLAAGSGSRFFLPTNEPTNTTTPRQLADANGGRHML